MTVVSRVNDSDYPVPYFYLFFVLCCVCIGRVLLARRVDTEAGNNRGVLTLKVVKSLDGLFLCAHITSWLHAHKKRGSS